jgi:ERCC4-type nuclease
MKMCVDDREHTQIPKFKEFIASKKSDIITDIEVERSPVGDAYTKDGVVGIERKAGDMVPSMYSKQLDKQLKELVDNFQHPFLFIEYDGILDMIQSNLGVNPKSLIGELTSIMARHRVTIMFTGNYERSSLYVPFTVRCIEKFYDGKNKVKDIEYSPIRTGKKKVIAKRNPSPQEVKLDIISRIPHIGPKKSIELLEKYHWSITEIANASIEDIMTVKGVGKVLAEHIKSVLK